MSDQELYNQCLDRIVYVSGNGCTATGFIIEDSGHKYLYTCEHCIIGSEKISAKTIDGSMIKLGALQTAEDRDLVRFRVDDKMLGFQFSPREKISIGLNVVAVGDTLGDGVMTFNRGKILAVGTSKIEIDSSVQKGNSGGPVFNERGEIVGVVSSGSYRHDEMTKDTRYDKTRRFAENVCSVQWIDVDYNEYREKWRLIQDIKTLGIFMSKWDTAYWDTLSEAQATPSPSIPYTNFDEITGTFKSKMNDDSYIRLESMCAFLHDAECHNHNRAFNKFCIQVCIDGIENGRISFPADLLGVHCENIDSFIIESSKQESDHEYFCKIWRWLWYRRCVQECEAYIEELKNISSNYLGERDSCEKFTNKIQSKFKLQAELIPKSWIGIPVKYSSLDVKRFGEGDCELPLNPQQERVKKEFGDGFKRSR